MSDITKQDIILAREEFPVFTDDRLTVFEYLNAHAHTLRRCMDIAEEALDEV